MRIRWWSVGSTKNFACVREIIFGVRIESRMLRWPRKEKSWLVFFFFWFASWSLHIDFALPSQSQLQFVDVNHSRNRRRERVVFATADQMSETVICYFRLLKNTKNPFQLKQKERQKREKKH
jgi:hypothetical protein